MPGSFVRNSLVEQAKLEEEGGRRASKRKSNKCGQHCPFLWTIMAMIALVTHRGAYTSLSDFSPSLMLL
jgi:hypothetical protein